MFKCLRCRITHMGDCVPTCPLFPERVITVRHCQTCKNFSLSHPGCVSEGDFTAMMNSCEKEKKKGSERQSGVWGKPSLTVYSAKDLNCRKEEPCQQMPNQCDTAKPHLILLNQQKNYPLPDFSYLTNKRLGFFPY